MLSLREPELPARPIDIVKAGAANPAHANIRFGNSTRYPFVVLYTEITADDNKSIYFRSNMNNTLNEDGGDKMGEEKTKYYALYQQWANSLKLQGEVSQIKPEVDGMRNFAVLSAGKKVVLERFLTRSKEILKMEGITVMETDIADGLWYKKVNGKELRG